MHNGNAFYFGLPNVIAQASCLVVADPESESESTGDSEDDEWGEDYVTGEPVLKRYAWHSSDEEDTEDGVNLVAVGEGEDEPGTALARHGLTINILNNALEKLVVTVRVKDAFETCAAHVHSADLCLRV